jgi:hypothetical protein
MEAGPNDSDTQDLDGPTLPFTRKEVDLQLRMAAAAATSRGLIHEVVDKDWFELAGRRIRISLTALTHIGNTGTPANMITSGQSGCVAGEIDIYEASRAHRLWWQLSGAVALLLVLAALALALRDTSEPTPPTKPTEPIVATVADPALVPAEPTPDVEDPPRPIVAEVQAEAQAEAPPPPTDPPVRRRARGEAATSVCVAERRDAEHALSKGEWAEAERLTRSCWQKSRKIKGLRMRVLFELDRLGECIELGEGDRAKEVSKWYKNCSRALQ